MFRPELLIIRQYKVRKYLEFIIIIFLRSCDCVS